MPVPDRCARSWCAADGVERRQAALDRVAGRARQPARTRSASSTRTTAPRSDRKAQLDAEIAVAQAKVDELSGQLGELNGVLQDIAVADFTSAAPARSARSSSATAATLQRRRADATRWPVALDTGETDADELQSLVDDLAASRR